MKVLYLQLPVLDFGYDYWGADHPLAGGYMAAYCLTHGIDHEPLFLPQKITSFASTLAILDEILRLDPDVVVATLYLWNIERTARLLHLLKQERPKVRLLGGGPEAAGRFGRRALGGLLDILWKGEGEVVLAKVLAELMDDPEVGVMKLRSIASSSDGLLSLHELPSPYLEGVIGLAPDRSLWVESMRGCPFRCAYCYYGKSFSKVRWFPKEWIERHVLWANEKGAQEIYFLDPSFQVLPSLEERLKEIARWNRKRVRLHTEARVEMVDSRLADLFREAGFSSIETGLQSTNNEVLKKIGRSCDTASFARGAHLLLERGVDVEIDIILGLPGDTPESFLATVEFLVGEGLSTKVNVFPLLVLPGTRLEERAKKWGVKYMKVPPYQVEATEGGMDIEAMRAAMEEAEKRLHLGLYPLHLPEFASQGEGWDLIGVVEIPPDETPEPGLPEQVLRRLAQCPVFLFREGKKGLPWEKVIHWALWQRANIPDILPFWVLELNSPFPQEELIQVLPALHDPSTYQARLWNLCPDPYLRMSSRPFVLSTCKGQEEFWMDINSTVPVIRLVREPGFWSRERDPLRNFPVLWETDSLIRPILLRELRGLFQGREEELLFTRWENTVSWAMVTGMELPLTRPRFGRIRLP